MSILITNQPQLLDANILAQFPQLTDISNPTVCYLNSQVKDKNGQVHQRSTFARLVTKLDGSTFLIRKSAPGTTPLGDVRAPGLVLYDTTLPISGSADLDAASVEPLVDPETKQPITCGGLPIKRIIAWGGTHVFTANQTKELAPGFVETVQVPLQLAITADKHLSGDRRPRAAAKTGGNAVRSANSAFDAMAPETE